MGITVKRVCDAAGLRSFLRLPHRVYADDPLWVPQIHSEIRRTLDTRANPYFAQAASALFTANRDGDAVARLCVTVNHAYRDSCSALPALFGFFEAFSDVEAVLMLFDEAKRWAYARGAVRMVGPFHPHHYSELGVQISGFDERPTFFQTHHPSYYPRLLGSCGFKVESTFHTRRNLSIGRYLQEHPKVSLRSNGLDVRRLDEKDVPGDLERIRYVFNDAFIGHPYFLPLSREEYAYSSVSLRYITRPSLNVIVEHHGEPVGALQCVLDVNPILSHFRSGSITPLNALRFYADRRRIRRVIVFAVGIRRAWQRGRVHALLFNALHEIASEFEELETTWMDPDNPMSILAAERFGLVPDKHFALFHRSIAQTGS